MNDIDDDDDDDVYCGNTTEVYFVITETRVDQTRCNVTAFDVLIYVRFLHLHYQFYPFEGMIHPNNVSRPSERMRTSCHPPHRETY
jgi:hypothetical protein